ncbi:MAG: transcriptional regulator [Pedobacter sp.]|nr:MAG: transcriptional regulator [Pedobacter sp.]
MNIAIRKVILPFTAVLCLIVVSGVLAGNVGLESSFAATKQIIALRQVGHEVLLQSGDTTSRVLPVSKINETEYQIRFEKKLTFQPDSLVKIVKRSLAASGLSSDYVVSVISCKSMEIVFGYAILKSEKNEMVPCRQRVQPADCYLINIKFQEGELISNNQQKNLFQGMPIVLALGYCVYAFVIIRKKKHIKSENEILLGLTVFNPEAHYLLVDKIKTELTAKETGILLIFAKSPNEVIDRSRLQKDDVRNYVKPIVTAAQSGAPVGGSDAARDPTI